MSEKAALFFKNATLLDVSRLKTVEDRSVYIKDGLIRKIGPGKQLAPIEKQLSPETVFDLGGRLLMPGLIDAHVHLSVIQKHGVEATSAENMRASESLLVLYGAHNAMKTLKSGFTTVRDVGQGDVLALRNGIDRGIVPGPSIVACGWMGMTGGHQQCMNAEFRFNQLPRPRDLGVDGPWAVRRKVRQLVSQGVDAIKTFASGAGYRLHPFDQTWRERPNYTLEEMQALVDEAHTAGRRVAAHALTCRQGIKIALAAGVDTLEHGIFLDDDDIETMLTRGSFYVPTLAVMQMMFDPDARGESAYLKISPRQAQSYLEAHMDSFQRARSAGVKIVLGSDTFRVIKQGQNARELEWLVKAGMSPVEALAAGTKTAAEALGIDHLVGSVVENLRADLIVVDPDPLTDISVLRDPSNIKMIVKEGKIA